MNMARSAPRMRLVPVVFVFLLALFSSCKSQCRQLSERMCECALNTNDKSACLGRAANAEGANPPTYADEDVCRKALQPGECDCRLIDTPKGKIKCGLARDPEATPDAG